MNIVQINGKEFVLPCRRVTLKGREIFFEDEHRKRNKITLGSDYECISIEGDVGFLSIDSCDEIQVTGDVDIVHAESGNRGIVCMEQDRQSILYGRHITVFGENIPLIFKKITITIDGNVEYINSGFCSKLTAQGEISAFSTYLEGFKVTRKKLGFVSTESLGIRAYQD